MADPVCLTLHGPAEATFVCGRDVEGTSLTLPTERADVVVDATGAGAATVTLRPR